MNISRLNYTQTLPLIKQSIRQAHFLAFDLEMSGIMTEELTSPSIIDSMQARYEKQKQSISKFIPLQFGLSTFTLHPQLNKIIAQPFNFYIFPLGLSNDIMKFSFHAGTMNFLTKNSFDFNKLFYEAIPYANGDRLSLYKKTEVRSQLKRQLRKLRQLQSPQTKAFINLHLPLIQAWIQSAQPSLDINIKQIKYLSYMNLKQKIQELHPEQPLQFTFDNETVFRRTKMTLKKCTSQQKLNQQQPLDCNSNTDPFFNEVFDQIVNSKKPIILHNGFLDLMHIEYRFRGKLPNKWTGYKERIKRYYPLLYDNKYLFNTSPMLSSLAVGKQTSLESCFLGMRRYEENIKEQKGNQQLPVNIEIDPDFHQYSLDNLQCHEAGFDSLMTGYSFLRGVTILNNNLSLLTNPLDFSKQHDLIKNRIPQGSIKIPFNLNDREETDIYTQDGNSPFYFKSIINQLVSQSSISDFFSSNFGPVSFYWTNREMSEFCLNFLSEESQKKFQEYLKQHTGFTSSIIIEIASLKLLVLNSQDQHKSMNNFINNEIEYSNQLEQQSNTNAETTDKLTRTGQEST